MFRPLHLDCNRFTWKGNVTYMVINSGINIATNKDKITLCGFTIIVLDRTITQQSMYG